MSINGMIGSNFFRSVFAKKSTYMILAVLTFIAFYSPCGVMNLFYDAEKIAEQVNSYEESVALHSLHASKGTNVMEYYPVAELTAYDDSGQSKLRYRLFPFLYFPISVEYRCGHYVDGKWTSITVTENIIQYIENDNCWQSELDPRFSANPSP